MFPERKKERKRFLLLSLFSRRKVQIVLLFVLLFRMLKDLSSLFLF